MMITPIAANSPLMTLLGKNADNMPARASPKPIWIPPAITNASKNDSNADPATGLTDTFTLAASATGDTVDPTDPDYLFGTFSNPTIDAGVIVTPLPLYHVYSLTANLMCFVALGGENLLITDPRDLPGFIAELRKRRFAFMTGVNTLYNALLHSQDFGSLDFSALRVSMGGGMAVQRAVAGREGSDERSDRREVGEVERHDLNRTLHTTRGDGGAGALALGDAALRVLLGTARATAWTNAEISQALPAGLPGSVTWISRRSALGASERTTRTLGSGLPGSARIRKPRSAPVSSTRK